MQNKALLVARILGSALLGALAGILFHYYLYRIGLPVNPFIYQAF